MPKRELSPESKERKQRPIQQQKSVSDIIGPMVAQVHLDLSNNSSLDSMASQNVSAAMGNDNFGSSGSSRKSSQELGEGMDDIVTGESCRPTTANDELLEADFTDVDGRVGDAMKAVGKAGKKMVHSVAKDIETVVHGSADMIGEAAKCAAENIEDTVEGSLDLFAGGLHKASNLADLAGACVLQKQVSVHYCHTWCVYLLLDDVARSTWPFQKFKMAPFSVESRTFGFCPSKTPYF